MSDEQNPNTASTQPQHQPAPENAGAPPSEGSTPVQPTESASALLQQQNEALAEHSRVVEGQLSDIKDQLAVMGAAHDDLAKRVEDIERRRESTAERPSQEPLEDARLPLETRVARLEGKLKHL